MDARVKVWKAIKMLKFPYAKAVRYSYAWFALQTSRVHPWLHIRTLSINQVFNKNAILIELLETLGESNEIKAWFTFVR